MLLTQLIIGFMFGWVTFALIDVIRDKFKDIKRGKK